MVNHTTGKSVCSLINMLGMSWRIKKPDDSAPKEKEMNCYCVRGEGELSDVSPIGGC